MKQYYQKIYNKIKNKEFEILKIKSLHQDKINIHIETLNYMKFKDKKNEQIDIQKINVITELSKNKEEELDNFW